VLYTSPIRPPRITLAVPHPLRRPALFLPFPPFPLFPLSDPRLVRPTDPPHRHSTSSAIARPSPLLSHHVPQGRARDLGVRPAGVRGERLREGDRPLQRACTHRRARSVSDDPQRIADSSKILTNMGLIYATLGEHELAVEQFIAATGLDQYLAVACVPSVPSYDGGYGSHAPCSYFQCGVSNFLLARYELAFKDFDEALLYLRGNESMCVRARGARPCADGDAAATTSSSGSSSSCTRPRSCSTRASPRST
jgi:hypothetical protein